MKAVFFILLFVLFSGITAYFLLFGKEEIKNVPTKEKSELVIVAIGDSLVEGVGATVKRDFVSLLSQKIGLPILNYGVSGDTSRDVAGRVGEVLENDPDIVLVLVGGNDALRKTPKEVTFGNIKNTVATLQESGSMVVLIGVQGGIVGNAYQKEYERIADETGALLVPDILDGLIGDSRYMRDAVHPNDAGYALIAEKVYQKLQPYLE